MTRSEHLNAGLLHVDLFCGLGGWSEPFQASDRWESVGLDIRSDLEADIIADVRHLPLDCTPTLVSGSPPCPEFSRYNMPWLDGDPEAGMELVRACLQAVKSLNPDYWILENVLGLHRYWKPARKIIRPYYFWGEFPPFDAAVTDGGKMQTSGKNPEERAKIPYPIADSLRRSVEVHYAE